jgi:hypothetical protein
MGDLWEVTYFGAYSAMYKGIEREKQTRKITAYEPKP